MGADEVNQTGAPAGSGTPAGSGAAGNTTPASTASGTPSSGTPGSGTNVPGSGTGTAGASATPASGADTGKRQYTYEEDRSNWVPPHRIREASTKAQRLEAELGLTKRQLAALTGVQPPAPPEDPEVQQVREQFKRLYPGLAKLADLPGDKLDRLMKLVEMDPKELSAPTEHYWTVMGHRTLNELFAEGAKVIGGELAPGAKRTLKAAFGAWLEEDENLQLRYAQQDPGLIADFFKDMQQGLFDPFRRKSTAPANQNAERIRRLPRQGGGGPVAGQPVPKPKPGDANFEESTHDNAWQKFQAESA